jgi:HSP20 family protein
MSNLIKQRSSWLQPFGDFLDADDFWGNNRWLPRAFQQHPAVNISEKDNEYSIELAVPGYKKEDFKVNTDDGLLTVSAETKNEMKEDGEEYTRREYNYNGFSRSFRLPENVKDDAIEAKYTNGLLKLRIPKAKLTAAKPKKEIAVAG